MVRVPRGGCRVCHKTVPGRPGTWSVCAHCGTPNLIPSSDPAVTRAPPIPSHGASAAPRPSARYRSRPPRGRLRISWAWVTGLVFLALAIGAGAANLGRFLPHAPTLTDMQGRLAAWDAAGDGSPYRMETDYGPTTGAAAFNFTRYIDARHQDEALWVHGIMEHRKGNLTLRSDASRSQLLRDWRGWRMPPTPEWRVTNQSGSTYQGTVDGHPFRLLVDHAQRFTEMTYNLTGGRTVGITYYYDDLRWPSFREDGARGGADVPPGPLGAQGGVRQRVLIGSMEDAARPNELQLTFYDFTDIPVEAASFNTQMNRSGYFFHWIDKDGNGLVDQGDAYEFEFPKSVARARVFDEWASQRVDPKLRLAAPEALLDQLAAES